MKDWLAGFADILLPDPVGQRAIDETIQDYREEHAQATTPAQRIWTDVRYVAALLRVFSLSSVRDLMVSDTWRVVASCLSLSLILVPLLLWLMGGFEFLEVVSFRTWIGVIVAPSILVAFGPIAALGMFERPDRPIKLVGPLVASALLIGLIWTWVMGARTIYIDEVLRSLGSVGQIVRPQRSLVSDVATLTMFAWYVLMAPTGLLFGAVIRRRWRHRARWYWLQLAGLLGQAIVVGSAIVGSALVYRVVGGPHADQDVANVMMITARWIPLLILWVTTLALVRTRNSQITDNQ